MARYGKSAGQKVKRAMHERKKGTLKSGRSGKTVKSRKQAIAIGLSEARRAGGKVPAKRSRKKELVFNSTTRGNNLASDTLCLARDIADFKVNLSGAGPNLCLHPARESLMFAIIGESL